MTPPNGRANGQGNGPSKSPRRIGPVIARGRFPSRGDNATAPIPAERAE